MIPLSEPYIAGNEWKYIKECLDTNWVSSAGKYVDEFEAMFTRYLSISSAIACVNGTAALHVALLVAGVKPDEEVLVPALTFAAPVNTVRYVNAWPVFMDVDPKTLQMDATKVAGFLHDECELRDNHLINRNTGRKVTAIIPVHILGHPVDMDPIMEVTRKFSLKVIEDATESLGAKYKGRPLGTIGDIACFSFNGNKIITTGGGGMIVTNNVQWANKARYLTTQAKDDPIEYIHNEIGYNYRLTNVQAAMGVAQMEKLDEYVANKLLIAKCYQEALAGLRGVTLPSEAAWAKSTFWLYTIQINENKYGLSSRSLMKKLQEAGIQSRPLWHPVHTLKPFADCPRYKIEVADILYRDCLSIPCSVNLTIEDQNRVIQIIKENAKA